MALHNVEPHTPSPLQTTREHLYSELLPLVASHGFIAVVHRTLLVKLLFLFVLLAARFAVVCFALPPCVFFLLLLTMFILLRHSFLELPLALFFAALRSGRQGRYLAILISQKKFCLKWRASCCTRAPHAYRSHPTWFLLNDLLFVSHTWASVVAQPARGTLLLRDASQRRTRAFRFGWRWHIDAVDLTSTPVVHFCLQRCWWHKHSEDSACKMPRRRTTTSLPTLCPPLVGRLGSHGSTGSSWQQLNFLY